MEYIGVFVWLSWLKWNMFFFPARKTLSPRAPSPIYMGTCFGSDNKGFQSNFCSGKRVTGLIRLLSLPWPLRLCLLDQDGDLVFLVGFSFNHVGCCLGWGPVTSDEHELPTSKQFYHPNVFVSKIGAKMIQSHHRMEIPTNYLHIPASWIESV